MPEPTVIPTAVIAVNPLPWGSSDPEGYFLLDANRKQVMMNPETIAFIVASVNAAASPVEEKTGDTFEYDGSTYEKIECDPLKATYLAEEVALVILPNGNVLPRMTGVLDNDHNQGWLGGLVCAGARLYRLRVEPQPCVIECEAKTDGDGMVTEMFGTTGKPNTTYRVFLVEEGLEVEVVTKEKGNV